MRKVDKFFWIVFVIFCIGVTVTLDVFDFIDLSKMGTTEDIIFITMLLSVGVAMRYWMYKNPEEMKRRLKL